MLKFVSIILLFISFDVKAEESAGVLQFNKASELLNKGQWQQAIDEFDKLYLMMAKDHGRPSIEYSAVGEWATPILDKETNTYIYDCAVSTIVISSLENGTYKYHSKYKGEIFEAEGKLLAIGRSGFVTRYLNEERLDDTGKPQVWALLMLTSESRFAWRRTDWKGLNNFTAERMKCEKELV